MKYLTAYEYRDYVLRTETVRGRLAIGESIAQLIERGILVAFVDDDDNEVVVMLNPTHIKPKGG